MKPVVCPRCHGSGLVEEDQTLVGIVPLLDRPSGVNDTEWTEQDTSEPTAVTEVPTFIMPLQPTARSAGSSRRSEDPLSTLLPPKLPRDLTRIATDSERPTKVIHGRKALLEKAVSLGRKRSWVTPAFMMLLMAIGIGMGFAAGLNKDRWVQLIQHMQASP